MTSSSCSKLKRTFYWEFSPKIPARKLCPKRKSQARRPRATRLNWFNSIGSFNGHGCSSSYDFSENDVDACVSQKLAGEGWTQSLQQSTGGPPRTLSTSLTNEKKTFGAKNNTLPRDTGDGNPSPGVRRNPSRGDDGRNVDRNICVTFSSESNESHIRSVPHHERSHPRAFQYFRNQNQENAHLSSMCLSVLGIQTSTHLFRAWQYLEKVVFL